MMGISLADESRNHCECPECSKLRPSDFLVMIVNALNEELTRRNLNTKVLLSTYVDQMFPPTQERVKNPDRLPKLRKVKELAARARVLALSHRVMTARPQTVCYRLLERHAECVEYLAEIMMEVCQANYFYASELIKKFTKEFGSCKIELDRYLDFGLLVRAYVAINYRGKNKIIVQ